MYSFQPATLCTNSEVPCAGTRSNRGGKSSVMELVSLPSYWEGEVPVVQAEVWFCVVCPGAVLGSCENLLPAVVSQKAARGGDFLMCPPPRAAPSTALQRAGHTAAAAPSVRMALRCSGAEFSLHAGQQRGERVLLSPPLGTTYWLLRPCSDITDRAGCTWTGFLGNHVSSENDLRPCRGSA